MTEQAQVGDTVRLTITAVGVVGKWKGEEHVMGYTLAGIDRTVEILSSHHVPVPPVGVEVIAPMPPKQVTPAHHPASEPLSARSGTDTRSDMLVPQMGAQGGAT